ncbi:lipoprotein [Variovorax sp. J22R133]|uniref:LPS translocon maturation chaperone LptM n=1 Tax=Variovorax brevis TaxID=3053503 RepID=UPI002576ADE8|nr:lipoprotein [Variovorax sp. J22R133]MDM0114448.1 lipoprotein [Variovorax sp. J22R133]
MLRVRQILVSAIGLSVLGVGLAGCGQRGPLRLPTEPAAANRATLPQTLTPSIPGTGSKTDSTKAPAGAPAAPAANAPAGSTP